MKLNKLRNKDNKTIKGPLEIIPNIFKDERGYFYETWNEKDFNRLINFDISFVQDNQSFSKKGTLRGLHFQLKPMSQGKLVRVTKGKVFDVIIDLRQSSETFSSWTSLILDCERKNLMWIPEGFAHGFLTLSEEAIVEYKVTNYWNKDLDRTLLWNDSRIGIQWPNLDNNLLKPQLSLKDKNGSTLSAIMDKDKLF